MASVEERLAKNEELLYQSAVLLERTTKTVANLATEILKDVLEINKLNERIAFLEEMLIK